MYSQDPRNPNSPGTSEDFFVSIVATFNFSCTASQMLSSYKVSQLAISKLLTRGQMGLLFALLQLFLLNVLRKHLKVLTLARVSGLRHFNGLALHPSPAGEHDLEARRPTLYNQLNFLLKPKKT